MTPVAQPLRGRIRPPGSKSLTNRALVIAALARGDSLLTGLLDSQDTRVMVESWKRLGLNVSQDVTAQTVRIHGCGGTLPNSSTELWLENSGTSIRFLTAVCAICPTSAQSRQPTAFRLDGNARMRERPIEPLVAALQHGGLNVHCELGTGCPPVVVQACGWPGGRLEVSGTLSSQYLSALLMAAPCAGTPVQIAVTGELVSRPYIEMTIAMMRQFGAEVTEVTAPDQSGSLFQISPTPYVGREYEIEPDASAASYFFAAAAVTGGSIRVEGLSRNSLQGDVGFVDALVQMGCRAEWGLDSITLHGGPLHGIEIDMNAISDTAQTLSCVAPFATGPTRIRNVAHMRLKETDRVAAVVTELRRLGLQVEEHEDGLTIFPGAVQPGSVQTYDDHRMAMSFAILGLKRPGIKIEHPECTAKTYPHFFEDLCRICN